MTTYTIRSWDNTNPVDVDSDAFPLRIAAARARLEGSVIKVRHNLDEEVRTVYADGTLGKHWADDSAYTRTDLVQDAIDSIDDINA